MNEKKHNPGDIVYEVSLLDLCISSGITASSVARDIAQTDKMYSSRWQVETASTLAALSDMLHHAITVYKEELGRMMISPPEDVMIVIVRNPLLDNSMSTSPSEDGDYDMTEGDDFPF